MTLKYHSILLLIATFISINSALGQDEFEFENQNRQFAFDFFKELYNPKGNTLFSPYSISSALAMTYAGARNNTIDEMADVMHFSKDSIAVHKGFQKLNQNLQKKDAAGDISIKIANSIWSLDPDQIRPEFFELLKKYYGPVIFPLKGAKPINEWVAKETANKINDLVKEENLENATLVLINALFFEGGWETTFDEKNTHKENFFTYDGKSVEVDMMYQEISTNFVKSENYDLVVLPYKNDQMWMVVVLPKEGKTIQEVVQELALSLEEAPMLTSFCCSNGKSKISIPKFKIDTPVLDLGEVFKKMGMEGAFAPGTADFSGMSSGMDLFIDKIMHKCFLNVNEKGSAAGASTAVIMQDRSIADELEIKINRPFFFFISDVLMGNIFFMGSVTNPMIK